MSGIKKIALLDTSIMSYNMGDKIIMESIKQQLQSVIVDSFIVDMPTKTPLFHWYEFSLRKEDDYRKNLNSFDYKFVCGTNLLLKNMNIRKPSWNMHMWDLRYIKDFILVAVGTDSLEITPNNYTKQFYDKALSSSYYHSVRDEKTKVFLQSMGIKSINTGCATLWKLTEEHCSRIPKGKSKNVIFTITDYAKNPEKDYTMIKTLLGNYDQVWFWVQGFRDLEYLESMCNNSELSRIGIISPSLEAYNNMLSTLECDYVGTRLHAGIKAMQRMKRSIIIGVDNRAKDINDDCNLNYIPREDIDMLGDYLNSTISTEIKLNKQAIEDFIYQFK